MLSLRYQRWQEGINMKILITSEWYVPVVNGVVTSVCNLERELRKRGHEVRILTLSEDHTSHQERDV